MKPIRPVPQPWWVRNLLRMTFRGRFAAKLRRAEAKVLGLFLLRSAEKSHAQGAPEAIVATSPAAMRDVVTWVASPKKLEGGDPETDMKAVISFAHEIVAQQEALQFLKALDVPQQNDQYPLRWGI